MRSASRTRSWRSRLRDLSDHQAVGDVVANRHVREEGVVLEDGVHVSIERRHAGHVASVQQHASFAGLLEAGNHAQGRGLAGARRAEHREELAVCDIEVDAGDRLHVAEALDHAFQPHGRDRPRRIGRWMARRVRGCHGRWQRGHRFDGHKLLEAARHHASPVGPAYSGGVRGLGHSAGASRRCQADSRNGSPARRGNPQPRTAHAAETAKTRLLECRGPATGDD